MYDKHHLRNFPLDSTLKKQVLDSVHKASHARNYEHQAQLFMYIEVIGEVE